MADIIVGDTGNPVTNGTNFQTALNSANPGDRVILTAGATYDGSFTLADKGASSGSPITITTSATLPDRRIGPSDVSLLARVRTLGGGEFGEVLKVAANAGWWIIDGLEITDNGPSLTVINMLVNCNAVTTHDIVIKRCYFHNKETGTDYDRAIRWGVDFEGSGLTLQWNYFYLIGYYEGGGFVPMDTMALGCVVGNTITVHDNYISFWYVGFFLGGGDSDPQNTATISSSSTTSGTFSNVTGLAAGVVLRLDFEGTGTAATAGTFTVTRTAGATMTSADIGQFGRVTGGGSTGVFELTGVAGDVYTLSIIAGGAIPDGSCTFAFYETAMVDSVDGSVVDYTPFGFQALVQAPAKASWNYGDQGLCHDITITHNTFYNDPDFYEDVIDNNGNHSKGFFEIKNVRTMLLEGNYFLGAPTGWAWTGVSQNRTAPWITTRDVTVRYNWVAPNLHDDLGFGIIITDNQYLATNTPSRNFDFNNNFFTHGQNLFQIGGGGIDAGDELDNVSFTHNTVINDGSAGGYNSAFAFTGVVTTFEFTDNIIGYRANGLQCFVDPFSQATCLPDAESILNNVAVDVFVVGATTSSWGTGSILSPIPTTFNDVGFVNISEDNYELSISSNYKGEATDSTDPGVNWSQLLAALEGIESEPSTVILLGACLSE